MIGFQKQISACELFANVSLQGLLSDRALISPSTRFLLSCWAKGGFPYKSNNVSDQRANNMLPSDRA